MLKIFSKIITKHTLRMRFEVFLSKFFFLNHLSYVYPKITINNFLSHKRFFYFKKCFLKIVKHLIFFFKKNISKLKAFPKITIREINFISFLLMK